MKDHYEDLLSTALRAYTLPNIDTECTLSIGVSFFPKHGHNLSEVLRKADIALYEAKGNGRNQIVFFEDKYDNSQKFKNSFVNILPVLFKSGNTFGYELVDRGVSDSLDEHIVNLDGFNHTLDALGLRDIENNMHYFITYTSHLLTPAVLWALPREKFIVEIHIPPDPKEGDLQVYQELRKAGYKLALVGVNSATVTPDVLNLADYCKFVSSDQNYDVQKQVIEANPRIRFIATGVNTQANFETAKAAGFNLYQGFFFNQPVVVQKAKELSPLKVNYFRLLKLTSTDDFLDFREISSIVSSDVALTYKLLRILNSAAVGLRKVSSITMAVTYMGEDSLKKWIAVLALRGIAEEKPLELVRLSLIRARFGELLAPHFRVKRNPKQTFMVGMLSLLNIALEKTKEQLLEEIPVTEDIRNSLLTKTGPHSDLLRFFENYEYSNWDAVSQFIEDQQIDQQIVNDSFIAAVKWYNDLITGAGAG
jgi:EAL and modified HD-GYP domain-containing signal transduction protein